MPYGWSTHDFTDDDLRLVPVWICDTVHWPVPMTPLYATSLLPQPSWYWLNASAQYFSEPRSKGFEHRLRNGYMYISWIPVPEDEVPAREKKFRERMAPVLDDP